MTNEERKEYLEDVAEDFGIDASIVFEIADLLGPDEDFDGLISTLEDHYD